MSQSVQILDAQGKPIKIENQVLKDDVAKAYTTGIRNPRPPSVASTLTPHRLATILRSVVEGSDPESYMTLAEEMEERDLHYSAQLRTRKLAVAAIEPSVEAVSDDEQDLLMAKRVQHILDSDHIPELFFDLLDGLGKGIGVSQIIWNTNAKAVDGAIWQPKSYNWVDPRYLRQDQETLSQILLISDDAPSGEPLTPYKFIVHKPRSKSGSIWRNGLARLVAVMYMLKSFTVRDWWAFAEVFGIPVRVGKYGPNATDTDIQTLVTAISRIASDAGAVIPESMKIDFVESANAKGGDILFEKMARWCDEQVSKAVLGQTMTADDGSSQSQANVHNEVRQDIAKWDARQLESTINEYLVKPFIILNWGVQERYPKVRIQIPEPEDLKALVDSLVPLIDRGLAISAASVRDKFGLKAPNADDELLHALNAQPQAESQQNQTDVKTDLNRSQSQVERNRSEINSADEIDEFTQEALDEWEDVGAPIVEPVIDLVNSASSYEEFEAKLSNLAQELDADAFIEQMSKLCWESRALGDVSDV